MARPYPRSRSESQNYKLQISKVLAPLGTAESWISGFHLEFGVCNLECWKSAAALFQLVRGIVASVHKQLVQVRRRDRTVLGRIAGALVNAFLEQPNQHGLGHRAVRFAVEMIHRIGLMMFRKITRLLAGQTIVKRECLEKIQAGLTERMLP